MSNKNSNNRNTNDSEMQSILKIDRITRYGILVSSLILLLGILMATVLKMDGSFGNYTYIFQDIVRAALTLAVGSATVRFAIGNLNKKVNDRNRSKKSDGPKSDDRFK